MPTGQCVAFSEPAQLVAEEPVPLAVALAVALWRGETLLEEAPLADEVSDAAAVVEPVPLAEEEGDAVAVEEPVPLRTALVVMLWRGDLLLEVVPVELLEEESVSCRRRC